MADQTADELLDGCVVAFDAVEKELAELTQPGKLQDMMNERDSVGKSKLQASLAYSLSTIYWMYLRTTGVDPSTHAISKEIERIRKYMQKIKTETEKKEDVEAKHRIDQDAANRFIAHGAPKHREQLMELNKKRKKSKKTPSKTQKKVKK